MFAGPNGSGKSTLKKVLPVELLGVYLNPDDIEKDIRSRGFLSLASYGIETSGDEILTFFDNSSLLHNIGLTQMIRHLDFKSGKLYFHDMEINAYLAAVVADFLRQKHLAQRVSFTFETVMSSSDKVAFLKRAQSEGCRTYLCYIATDDPEINISRVRNRVKQGGHDVPEDKIITRYWRSLDLLMDAIRNSHRAYIFDNSSYNQDHTWLAEITDGDTLEMKQDWMPVWFKRAVWDKIT